MKKTIFALLSVFLVFSVWSQTSPVKKASGGRFSNHIDNIVDVNSWSGTMTDKFFIFSEYSGLSSGNQAGSSAQLLPLDFGFAGMFSDIYFGAYYNGQIALWDNTVTSQESLNGIFSKLDATGSGQHSLQVLIGWKNLGFKLGFTAAGDKRTGTFALTPTGVGVPAQPDSLTDYSPKGFSNTLVYMPELAIGANFAVGNFVIKPYVGIAVSYSPSDKFAEQTDKVNGIVVTAKENNNFVTPNITAKLGFDFGKPGSAGIKYQVVRPFYLQNSVIINDGTAEIRTNKYKTQSITHTITADYAYSQDVTDQFSFGLKGELVFGIVNSVANDLWRSVNGVVTVNGTENATGNFSFTPTLSFGTQYAIKPDKVLWYAGLSVTPTYFLNTRKIEAALAPDNVVLTRNNETKGQWYPVSSTIGTGFTIQFVKNIGIDASLLLDLVNSNGTFSGTVLNSKFSVSLHVGI